MRLALARCTLVIAAGLACLIGAAPAPTPLDALLARIAAASGEPWRAHVVSISSTRALDKIVTTTIETQDDRVLIHRCSADVCDGSYTDGDRVVVFGYNESPVPTRGPADRAGIARRAVASYAFTAPVFRALGGTVVDVGTGSLREHAVRVLKVTTAGLSLHALIDPQSFLLRGIADTEGHVLFTYDDERRVGTLMLPFSVGRGLDPPQPLDDRTVDAAPLVAPRGIATTFRPQSSVALAREGSLPRFPCRVETIAATCLLDTGASGLSMSLELADKLHKTPVGQLELQGLGSVLSGVVDADSLDLGGVRYGRARYAVLPDARGFGADVIVGTDAISRCVVRLDLRGRTVAFAPLQSPMHGTIVPLQFEGYTASLDATLGSLETPLWIDTGDEASIDLPLAMLREHPTLFATTGRRSVIGVGGRSEQASGTLAAMQIGSTTYRDVAIGATDAPVQTHPRLGAAFFEKFVIELDYANGRMSFAPKP